MQLPGLGYCHCGRPNRWLQIPNPEKWLVVAELLSSLFLTSTSVSQPAGWQVSHQPFLAGEILLKQLYKVWS